MPVVPVVSRDAVWVDGHHDAGRRYDNTEPWVGARRPDRLQVVRTKVGVLGADSGAPVVSVVARMSLFR